MVAGFGTPMIRFISRRLLFAIPLLLGIVTITFFVIQVAPGDPMDMFLEPRLQRQMDPESVELLRQKYGLDPGPSRACRRWASPFPSFAGCAK